MTYHNIADIKSIGSEFARKLEEVGVRTTQDLLAKAATADMRGHLASRTGIGEGLLTRWFQLADVMRLNGIEPHHGELLVAAGVPSLEKLRTYKPTDLVNTLVKVSTEKKFTTAPPTQSEVAGWFKTLSDMPAATPAR